MCFLPLRKWEALSEGENNEQVARRTFYQQPEMHEPDLSSKRILSWANDNVYLTCKCKKTLWRRLHTNIPLLLSCLHRVALQMWTFPTVSPRSSKHHWRGWIGGSLCILGHTCSTIQKTRHRFSLILIFMIYAILKTVLLMYTHSVRLNIYRQKCCNSFLYDCWIMLFSKLFQYHSFISQLKQ